MKTLTTIIAAAMLLSSCGPGRWVTKPGPYFKHKEMKAAQVKKSKSEFDNNKKTVNHYQ